MEQICFLRQGVLIRFENLTPTMRTSHFIFAAGIKTLQRKRKRKGTPEVTDVHPSWLEEMATKSSIPNIHFSISRFPSTAIAAGFSLSCPPPGFFFISVFLVSFFSLFFFIAVRDSSKPRKRKKFAPHQSSTGSADQSEDEISDLWILIGWRGIVAVVVLGLSFACNEE